MLKRKTLPAFITVLILALTAAIFGIKGVDAVKAEEKAAVSVTVTEVTMGCFDYEDGSNTTITGFTLPEDVTGYFKVVIPDSVTTINTGAFVGTDDDAMSNYFVAIELPNVTTVYADAFVDCKNLLEVCAPQALLDGDADGDSGLLVNAKSAVTNKADETLKAVSDENGKYLFVRDGIEGSKYVLVAYEGTATELVLPEPSVYTGCVTYSVNDNAFNGSEIVSVTVPEGVTAIGANAFANCAKLKEVKLSEGLVSIGGNAFYKSAVTSVTVPKSVTTISVSAFQDCASLAEVNFVERTDSLLIARYAFSGCTKLGAIYLPDGTTVRQYAFERCTSLRWVYVGENCVFDNNTGSTDAAFFPDNSLTIIFPSKTEFEAMANGTDKTFYDRHGDVSTYIVKVNCYIGASEQPVVYERLGGYAFNYVPNSNTGVWNEETANKALPVQDVSYSSTAWYTDSTLAAESAVTYDGVNGLLETQEEINLYCHETISMPLLSEEPVSWVYSADKSYDISDKKQVLVALGFESDKFSEAQLAAIDVKVVSFADENGVLAETIPETINANGTYSVVLSLKPEFGSWSQEVSKDITVNVNTNGFTTVMIVLLVIGVLAIIITGSTAIIRKKVQERNKKKQLSQQEVLEKFKANGGETTLQ